MSRTGPVNNHSQMPNLTTRIRSTASDFLFGDYRHLDERVRILGYGLLLWLSFDVFFQDILKQLQNTPDELFWPSGIMRAFFPVLDREDYAAFILHTRHAFIFLWLCATLGFLGRLPMVATGFFALVYWGIYKSDSGTNHTYHVPMYALLTMGLVCRPGRYSLDALLSRFFPSYPFHPSPPSKWEGFALKCLLTVTAYVFLSAGISKIWNGGLEWMDGETIHQYLKRFNAPSGALGERLFQFLLHHKSWIRALSIWSVAFELSFIIAVFQPRSRLFLFLNACAFHIGIYILLPPKYLPQMTVYLLLVNWDRLTVPDSWSFPGRPSRLFRLKKAAPSPPIPGMTLAISTGLYALLLSVLAFTIVIHREHYPLTHVPMYSNVMTEDGIGHRKLEDLRELSVLKEMSKEYLDREQPWYLTFHLPKQLIMEKKTEEGWEPQENHFMPAGVAPILWYHRVTVSLMRDLKLRSLSDHMAFPHADRVFKAVCRQNSLRTGWHQNHRLVWRLKGGDRVVSVCEGGFR